MKLAIRRPNPRSAPLLPDLLSDAAATAVVDVMAAAAAAAAAVDVVAAALLSPFTFRLLCGKHTHDELGAHVTQCHFSQPERSTEF